MNEKITMTTEELAGLKEVYGVEDPDIKAALEIADAAGAPSAKTGEDNPDFDPRVGSEEAPVPPTEAKDDAAASVEADAMERNQEGYSRGGKVPLAALHEERRKRQEVSQKAQQLEAELNHWRRKLLTETNSQQPAAGSVEEFIGLSPGKIAKQLFLQEQMREYDPQNSEHQERLQELTSLVTLKQFQTGEMYRQVQAARDEFSREVLAWRDEILEKPEVEYRGMERFAQMPDTAYKRMLLTSWERLVAGQASRDDFELIREFSAETEREMNKASISSASIQAAMNLPRTANVGSSAGMRADPALDLIERKLDQGEKLTAEEENLIRTLI